MNGRVSKKLRKMLGKQYRVFVDALLELPFGMRLQIIWKIFKGRR